MRPRVGVIGLGVIGQPIAERIAASGFPLAVYDVRPQPVAALVAAGAQGCRCAAEVAGSSDLVISLVLDEKQTEEVLFGGDGSALAARNEYGARWKKMLESTPPPQTPPNRRKDLHGALALAQQANVRLHLGAQASMIADAGIATGHDDPRL